MPLHVKSNTGVHLRSLVLISRHHHTPFQGVLQLEEIIFPLQSRLISREMHVSAESRKQRHRFKTQAAPLPNGKLGTISEEFSTIQQIRIGETCAWIAGCDDVLSGLRLDVDMCQPHECACMRWQEGHQDEQQKNYLQNKKKSSSGHVSIRNEDHQPESWHQGFVKNEKLSKSINCHQMWIHSIPRTVK